SWAAMLSTRTWRTAARAAASSLSSTIFRTVRRLTIASAIRPAISSRRGIRTEPTRPRRGESRNGRHGDRHARADAARALDVDRAAVSLDERFDDREPEAGAADRAGLGGPIVRLGDARERVVRNAAAAIADLDRDHRAGAARAEPHLAPPRRVLHGVRDEVGQN